MIFICIFPYGKSTGISLLLIVNEFIYTVKIKHFGDIIDNSELTIADYPSFFKCNLFIYEKKMTPLFSHYLLCYPVQSHIECICTCMKKCINLSQDLEI